MTTFPVEDRRASAGIRRTSSGLYTAGRNFDAVVRDMRAKGFTLPSNKTHARLEARRVVSDLEAARSSRGSATDIANRAMMADMRREKLGSSRLAAGGARGGFGTRMGANTQMVLPKVRQPMSSLMDKGIPFNVQDPKELIELRRWCRLFAATHPLIPLLIEIYCTFPVQGLQFTCKDPEIEDFYTGMFLDDLNYEEFLPDGLLKEYFTVGEATAFAHFNEELGTWASEELLDPDRVKISKSLFVEEERVQLLVKDMVEQLRDAPERPDEESPSERYERNWQYQQLVRHYPEIVQAAMQDDGLDISNALVSRIVDKAAWWDLRGTPRMLRSFRTLMMEESLHAAEDAVCDRLYAPLILATLGIENMGDGEPWIPDQGELEELRDDIQSAMAADLKVLVHNMGLEVTSVLGREAVPRLDTDYERVDTQIMQAWGIGQGLIMGGTASGGTYAGTAINREVVDMLMKKAQNKAKRHMRNRMEIIAEAQEHYDYDLKGGVRVPIYEHIEQVNEETGEKEIVRVPKLLIPEPEFATLNIRDEATERNFLSQLKELGVPISDGKLAIGVELDFEQQLEIQAAETYAKGMAQSQVMDKLQKKLDADGLPYPAELVQFLQATLTIRAQLAQTEMAEAQNKMADQQLAQASPAGMLGLLPGTTMQPLSGIGMGGVMGADPTQAGLPPSQGGDPTQASEAAPGASADPTLGAGAPAAADPSAAQSDPAAMQLAATRNGFDKGYYNMIYMAMHGPNAHPPVMGPPGGVPESSSGKDKPRYVEPPRNRTRPEESDEQRAGMPKTATLYPVIDRLGRQLYDEDGTPQMRQRDLSYAERGPSSYGHRFAVSHDEVVAAIRRRESVSRAAAIPGGPTVEALVHDPAFWATVSMGEYQSEIEADLPEILSGKGGAKESRIILEEALELYENATGIEPRWS